MSEQAHDSIQEYEEAFLNKNVKDEDEDNEETMNNNIANEMETQNYNTETLQKNTRNDSTNVGNAAVW